MRCLGQFSAWRGAYYERLLSPPSIYILYVPAHIQAYVQIQESRWAVSASHLFHLLKIKVQWNWCIDRYLPREKKLSTKEQKRHNMNWQLGGEAWHIPLWNNNEYEWINLSTGISCKELHLPLLLICKTKSGAFLAKPHVDRDWREETLLTRGNCLC